MPSPSTSNSNTRIFSPDQYFLGPPERVRSLEQPSDIIHHISSYDGERGVTRLAVNNLKAKRRADRTVRVDRESIVVTVEGVVKDERASCGAYFGKNSKSNISLVLPEEKPQTKELAVLLGTGFALKSAYELLFLAPSPSSASSYAETNEEEERKKIVIITDSLYLVKCMTDWMWVWQSEGFNNSKGKWVSNHVEIKGLGDICLEIEGIGTEVQFWLVEKGGVEDARRLAEKALDDEKWRREVEVR